jgi:hypothetical protein
LLLYILIFICFYYFSSSPMSFLLSVEKSRHPYLEFRRQNEVQCSARSHGDRLLKLRGLFQRRRASVTSSHVVLIECTLLRFQSPDNGSSKVYADNSSTNILVQHE